MPTTASRSTPCIGNSGETSSGRPNAMLNASSVDRDGGRVWRLRRSIGTRPPLELDPRLPVDDGNRLAKRAGASITKPGHAFVHEVDLEHEMSLLRRCGDGQAEPAFLSGLHAGRQCSTTVILDQHFASIRAEPMIAQAQWTRLELMPVTRAGIAHTERHHQPLAGHESTLGGPPRRRGRAGRPQTTSRRAERTTPTPIACERAAERQALRPEPGDDRTRADTLCCRSGSRCCKTMSL